MTYIFANGFIALVYIFTNPDFFYHTGFFIYHRYFGTFAHFNLAVLQTIHIGAGSGSVYWCALYIYMLFAQASR